MLRVAALRIILSRCNHVNFLLNLDKSATSTKLKVGAYKRACMEIHPDREGTLMTSNACQTLLNSMKKQGASREELAEIKHQTMLIHMQVYRS